MNDDGKVDGLDFAIFGSAWGNTYNVSTTPVAYSTSFEFDVPNDGDAMVWYYILVRFYVPGALSGQTFNLVAGNVVDDSIRNVKADNVLLYLSPRGGLFNLALGQMGQGYHLLELEYGESIGTGLINFSVKTTNNEAAWLDRFRIYVPNYGDNEYRYTVKTRTYFPGDDFFLGGYADDFIDDVYLDVGLLWQDWMWDMGPTYGTIYAWGDGFMYPLGWRGPSPHDITFTFGEIGSSGLLDFQYISWTHQQARIGAPKFYGVANASTAYSRRGLWGQYEYYGFIENAVAYGGSKWSGTIAVSDRFFELRTRITGNWTEYEWGQPTGVGEEGELEIGLGVGWAEPDMPRAMNDLGITINVTAINTTDFWRPWVSLGLHDYSVDVYSYQGLDLMGVEFVGSENSESIINTDWTVALDYTGTVIMFISGQLAQPIGAAVGLGMEGIAALVKLVNGQSVPSYTAMTSESHHYLVNATRDLNAGVPGSQFTGNPGSNSAALFFQLNPNIGHTCGLTKIVLRGTLVEVREWSPPVWFPMGTIEMTLYVPWFIW